jgi:hypothetical protein
VLPDLHLPFSPAGNLLISSLLSLAGSFLSYYMALNVDRKTHMIFYFAVEMLGLIIFTTATTTVFLTEAQISQAYIRELACLGLYTSQLAKGIGSVILYLYMLEVYPTVVRVTGSALCMGVGRLGSITSAPIYDFIYMGTNTFAIYFEMMYVLHFSCMQVQKDFIPTLISGFTKILSSYVFLSHCLNRIVFCVISWVLIYMLPWETRGVELATTFEEVTDRGIDKTDLEERKYLL